MTPVDIPVDLTCGKRTIRVYTITDDDLDAELIGPDGRAEFLPFDGLDGSLVAAALEAWIERRREDARWDRAGEISC